MATPVPAPSFSLELLRIRMECALTNWKGARQVAHELQARGTFTPAQAEQFEGTFRADYAQLLKEFSRRVIERR